MKKDITLIFTLLLLLTLFLVSIATGQVQEIIDSIVPHRQDDIDVEGPHTIAEKLTIEDVSLTMYAITTTDVRLDATLESVSIGQYKENEELEVTGKLPNGWVRVNFAGITGYVYKKDLSTEKPLAENTEGQEPTETTNKDPQRLDVVKDGNYLLALVTKNTTLGDYRPTDLVRIPEKMLAREGNRFLRQEAYEHLERMWEDAKNEGVTLLIVSAFRSFETQKNIFTRNASIHGEFEANRFSARPGQSEHQLGTTLDFVGHRAESLTASFAMTPAGKWLMQNSYKYGFVMSYPEGKEHITGYVFEPWHYRFIGVEAALEWRESGLTLKEFLKTKPQEFK